MADLNYEVWKDKSLAERFLNGVRGAMPLAEEQFKVVLKLIEMNKKPVFGLLGKGGAVHQPRTRGLPHKMGKLLVQ